VDDKMRQDEPSSKVEFKRDMSLTPVPLAASPREAQISSDQISSGVTFRVILLCLALAVFFGYVIPVIDMKTRNTFLGAAHLPPGAIAVLLVLLLVVNPLLRLLSKGLAFTRNEVLTVYITCLFSCLVPGHGAENFFITNIIGPFYYATRENRWLDFLQPYLKPWLTPALSDGGSYAGSGKAAVEAWFTGLGPEQAIPWGAWLVPLAVWGAFIFVSYTMLACLSVMLQAQWAEKEALAFPLLRLPLEMTEDVDQPDKNGVIGRFFRSPLMWVGFGIAATIQLMNGLHLYYPDVPLIPLEIPTGPLFTEPPWNQIGWTPMQVWPIVVGITYLLTSEVSFSLWFFFWFIKFQYIAAFYAGFAPNSLPDLVGGTGKTFVGYQQIGCYLAYVAVVLWTAREHLGHIARRAFGRATATEDEKQGALSYPVAFWGFLVSFGLVIAWSVAAGLSLHLALMMWTLYVVIAIALTRIVAEGGLLFVQQGWTPLGALGQIFNSGGNHWLLSSQSLVPASIIQGAMMTDLRAFIMPSFIQSFKLAHDRKIQQKPLLSLIFAVTLITLAMSLWMNVRLGYQHGGLALDPWYAGNGSQQPAKNASSLIGGVPTASWSNSVWVGVGAVLTYVVMLARSRFLWFPLHPLGFLMSLTYPMHMLWFSIFLGWLCKVLITRFGGSDTYRKTTPAFLGLALGDVTMMLFWLLVDGWVGRIGHKLMPG
jgi:hypothetical protein